MLSFAAVNAPIKPRSVEALRNAALAEMDKDCNSVSVAAPLQFDVELAQPVREQNTDDNLVSRHKGQNSPHVGNGRGTSL